MVVWATWVWRVRAMVRVSAKTKYIVHSSIINIYKAFALEGMDGRIVISILVTYQCVYAADRE